MSSCAPLWNQEQALLEKQQLLREEQQSYQATADEMQKVPLGALGCPWVPQVEPRWMTG